MHGGKSSRRLGQRALPVQLHWELEAVGAYVGSGRTLKTGACRTRMPLCWSTTSAARTVSIM
ncbi:similar to RRP22 (predicted), isoform CRA_b [Rattus norvegicus]|uniref:RAS-like, family 10, member A n=2 Tax=Rattus norvegicus TaxID=10116 RepID=D3ZA36_RAT|nr:ras-like protein family member 10A [Rattus norvegicus]EDM00269.1 similar to RRP22 (predicted), isoform CRA_b [Rattus norvegicus]|eukprot:NP_001102332.1 ras-like protein family member 10A [Rattus norvegicus]